MSSQSSSWPLLIPIIALILIAPVHAEGAGQLKVIVTGIAESIPIGASWVRAEPSLTGIIVPSREGWGGMQPSHVQKMIRIYFPRTYEELAGYDFFLLCQVDMTYFTGRQDLWMHDAIAERGVGGINTRSVQSMIASYSYTWVSSLLQSAFPNDALAVVEHQYYTGNKQALGQMVVNEDASLPPIVSPYLEQVERTFTAYRGLVTSPRPGSKIYTWIRTDLDQLGEPTPGDIPHLFEWTYLNGTTFTAMDMLTDGFWNGRENPFTLDIITNIIWHSSGMELPDDAVMVHLLRERFLSYDLIRATLGSVLEFAEKFGANTNQLYDELSTIEDRKDEADSAYLGGEFQESNDIMAEVFEDLEGLDEEAVGLKDRALAWVFAIEWLVVSATSMICGAVLWLVMVRRRLYREVGATRGRKVL